MEKCVVYVREGLQVSSREQFNECARYAKRYNLSIEHKIFDIRGDRFTEAINTVFANDIKDMIVYTRKAIAPELEDVIFYQIYLTHLGVTLHIVN